MNISIIDGSNYFKGLLLLIRKDRKLTVSEIMLMQKIGKKLGFEKEFCDTAINDIMENEYIEDTPPVFTSQELAQKFINDGLAIAFSDRECHPSEEAWLLNTAVLNGVDEPWFRAAYERAASRQHPPSAMEAEDITVQYS
jgi:tellurite resistance protein